MTVKDCHFHHVIREKSEAIQATLKFEEIKVSHEGAYCNVSSM